MYCWKSGGGENGRKEKSGAFKAQLLLEIKYHSAKVITFRFSCNYAD